MIQLLATLKMGFFFVTNPKQSFRGIFLSKFPNYLEKSSTVQKNVISRTVQCSVCPIIFEGSVDIDILTLLLTSRLVHSKITYSLLLQDQAAIYQYPSSGADYIMCSSIQLWVRRYLGASIANLCFSTRFLS